MSRAEPSQIHPRRVLFLSPAAALGGAERCLIDFVWATRQLQPRVQVQVISLAHGPLNEALADEGADVRVLELPGSLAELGEQPRVGMRTPLQLIQASRAAAPFLVELVRAVRSCAPDVVHTNGMKAHLLGGVTAGLRARLVVHLHDFVSTRSMTSLLLPRLAWRGAHFVANSQAVAADFLGLAPRASVRVVYNAIDTEYFSPGPHEPAWLAERAGLPVAAPDSVSFGLVATYARWKGQDLFLEAARRFFEQRPESAARFYIVGGPIYATRGSQFTHAELAEMVSRLGLDGRVGLVPFQADIARVFRALNVLVHASTQPEPFGRTVVEAMSTERPVVVSNQGGAAELFDDGVTALGFAAGNPADLCRRMLELDASSALRHSLGRAARRAAVERFSRNRLPGELADSFGFD